MSMDDPPNFNPLCILLYNYAKECTEPLAVQYSYCICQNPLESGVNYSRSCHYESALLLQYLL